MRKPVYYVIVVLLILVLLPVSCLAEEAAAETGQNYLFPALLILAIIIGVSLYIKFRPEPKPKADALALLDEFRFTVRRLDAREVVIPERLKETDSLDKQIKEKRFEWAVLELGKRIMDLKELEQSFDRARAGTILLEAENSRLREKDVVFEDRLEEIKNLFIEGSYEQVSELSQEAIGNSRIVEKKHDSARENLAALTNEIERIRVLDMGRSVIEDYWEDDK